MRDALQVVLALARTLTPEELPRLLGELAEVSATATARLASSAVIPTRDELLTVQEVSERMKVSKDFIYRRGRRWPFCRPQGRKLLFSSAGLDAYLRRAR
jgi:excisionase family DNA binding protein